MLHPSRNSLPSLAGLSSSLHRSFHPHSIVVAITSFARSLFSLVITITIVAIVLTFFFLLATSRGPMPAKSKIPVAVTMPTKSPDKLKPSSPSNGLPSKDLKKPAETTGPAPHKAQDGQNLPLQTGEEKIKNGTNSKSPSSSPTRAGRYLMVQRLPSGTQLLIPRPFTRSLLRRSSRRIPERQHERIVPLPAAKDIHGLGRVTPPRDVDDIKSKITVQVKEVDPKSDGLGIEPSAAMSKKDDIAKELEEEEDLDKPFELFDPPSPVTVTPPDSPENIFSHQPTFSTTIRPLASKSGFSARMDTISERSAEFESSEQGNSRPVSLSSTKSSTRPASVQADDLAPSPPSSPPSQDPVQSQDEGTPASSPDPPSPWPPPAPAPAPTPPQPLPAPAPAAIIEQASSDSLIAADLRAIGAHMNTISSDYLSVRTTLRGSMRLRGEASCQSIDSVLNSSILSLSSSQTDSVQDRLRMDFMAARGILSSLPRPQLPDNIIDTSNPFALLVRPSRSSSIQTTKTSKPGKLISTNEQSRENDQKENGSRVSEFLGPVGKESIEGKGLPADDAPSLFQKSGQAEANDAKRLLWPARSSHVQRNMTTNSQENPFQLPQLSKTPSGVKLGLDFGIPISSSSSQYSSHLSLASNKQDEYDQDRDRDGRKAAENRVNHSRPATLTSSLVSALDTQDRQGPHKLMPQEAAIFASLNDPIIPLIARFHAEELLFCRRVVSFTCDPRAATSAAFVSVPQRKSFRRVQKPVSEFGYEIQRYCLKYVAGYDLSWQIKKIQAHRQRQGSRTGVGPNSTLSGEGYRNGHGDTPSRDKGPLKRETGERQRGRNDGVWAAHRLSVVERDCGCDRGSCSSAGSSKSKKKRMLDVEVDTKPLTSLFDDDNRQHSDTNNGKGREKYTDEGTEMPAYKSRPPTPSRGKESPGRLQNYGFWQRVTGQGKGKRVDRPTADEDAGTKPETGADELNGSDDEKGQAPEIKGMSQPLPQPAKKKEKRQPLYGDCPRLPKLGLVRESVDSSSQKTLSSTPSSTFRSMAATTSGTPTTPRTHLSSPLPEDNLQPAPAPPLPENESFSIQYGVHMATDAILSLRNFMDLYEDTYYEAQPDPDVQTQFAHPPILDFGIYPYAYMPQQPGDINARVQRTPAQSAAYTRYQDLVRKSDNHIMATVLVLEEQTKTIKGVLDAAEWLDSGGDPRLLRKQRERPSILPSLLRKEKNPLASGDGTGEFMMYGALPNTDSLGSSLMGSEDEEDDFDSQRMSADNVGGYYPPRHSSNLSLVNLLEHHSNGAAPGNRNSNVARLSTHTGKHHQSSFQNPTLPASNGNNKKHLARILDARVVSAKFSYACARAEFMALKQISRFSTLDTYTYRSLMRFENRLEQLEDDLLGLDNRGFSSTAGISAGADSQGGHGSDKRESSGTIFGSGAIGCSGALAAMGDGPDASDPSSSGADSSVLTGGASNHTPGHHASPSQSTAASSAKRTSPGRDSSLSIRSAQGNPASTPRSSPSKTQASKHTGSQDNSPKGGLQNKSPKNNAKRRENTQNINQKSTTTKKMRRNVQKMRQSAESMVSIIIARRKGRRIGIADTEERQSLNSQEWDWFDSATGEVIPSPDVVRDNAGRQISRSTNHVERRSRIQHGAGCPYGGNRGADIYARGGNGPEFRSGSGETGLGLGLGALGGTTAAVRASPGSTQGRRGSGREGKSHSNHGGSATTGSTPVSIPANVSPGSSDDRGRKRRCPGCGVDLALSASRNSQPVPRIAGDDLPYASQGGSAQLGWVRRVMGPQGRKRASRYWFYHLSFRAPLLNGTEQDEDEQQEGGSHTGPPSPSRRLGDTLEEEEEEEEEEDESPSPPEGRCRRRKQSILSQHEDTYNALIGRGRDPVDPMTIPERPGTRQGRQRQRLVRRDRRRVVSDVTGDRENELRLIESHRRHAESFDLARTSWAHMEHATHDDRVGHNAAGGESRNINSTDEDSGVGLQRGSDDSNGSGSGGSGAHGERPRRQRGSLLALGLTRTRPVRSIGSGKSNTDTPGRRSERGAGNRRGDRGLEAPPSPGQSRGRTRVRTSDYYGSSVQGTRVTEDVNQRHVNNGDGKTQAQAETGKESLGDKRKTV